MSSESQSKAEAEFVQVVSLVWKPKSNFSAAIHCSLLVKTDFPGMSKTTLLQQYKYFWFRDPLFSPYLMVITTCQISIMYGKAITPFWLN